MALHETTRSGRRGFRCRVRTSYILEFLTYRDFTLDALVFYTWSVRTRDMQQAVPNDWLSNNNVYYGDSRDWHRQRMDVGPYMSSTVTDVQIGLGVVDMCGYWCGSVGQFVHSHAPFFDQVRLLRVNVVGPSGRFATITNGRTTSPKRCVGSDRLRAVRHGPRRPSGTNRTFCRATRCTWSCRSGGLATDNTVAARARPSTRS